MNKAGFYKGVIILLVLLNIGVLGYVYINSRSDPSMHRPRGGGPARMMVKRLKLDDRQQEQFLLLRTDHHSRLEGLRSARGYLHDQLFNLLKQPSVDPSARDSIMRLLQQNELQQEQLTFDHFLKLRAILHADQLPLFNGLVEDVGRQLMGPPPGRPMGPPPPEER